jgi:hypothetical protein
MQTKKIAFLYMRDQSDPRSPLIMHSCRSRMHERGMNSGKGWSPYGRRHVENQFSSRAGRAQSAAISGFSWFRRNFLYVDSFIYL